MSTPDWLLTGGGWLLATLGGALVGIMGYLGTRTIARIDELAVLIERRFAESERRRDEERKQIVELGQRLSTLEGKCAHVHEHIIGGPQR